MFSLFARLTKVDEATRTVYGRAVQEAPDHAGEIFDYEKSKPYFQSWSEGFSKSTNGLSVGNVRAMHGKVAAGKLTEMTFNDADKAIDVAAKIIDDQEWKKCTEGVYTGFSIGGKYIGEKVDDETHKGFKRYVASPNEISIVDAPCIPTATFTMVKANGMQEEVPFTGAVKKRVLKQCWTCAHVDHEHDTKSEAEGCIAITEKAIAKGEMPTGLRKEYLDLHALEAAAPSLTKGDCFTLAEAFLDADELNKSRDANENDGQVLARLRSAAAARVAKAKTEKTDAAMGSTLPAFGKFAADADVKTVRASWSHLHEDDVRKDMPDADFNSLRDAIAKAWREKIDPAGPPNLRVVNADLAKHDHLAALLHSDQEKHGAVMRQLAAFSGKRVEKGMYTVSSLAQLLDNLAGIQSSAKYEAEYEKDGSPIADKLREAGKQLGDILVAMAAEEVSEAFAPTGDEVLLSMTVRQDGVVKVIDVKTNDEMRKAVTGTSHKDALQAIHDHSCSMGAECSKAVEASLIKTIGLDTAGALRKRLGIDDDADLSAAITKALNDADDLSKDVPVLVEQIEKFRKAPAPATIATRAIAKDLDGNVATPAAAEPVKKLDGSIDEVATAIKHVHRSGSRPMMN